MSIRRYFFCLSMLFRYLGRGDGPYFFQKSNETGRYGLERMRAGRLSAIAHLFEKVREDAELGSNGWLADFA